MKYLITYLILLTSCGRNLEPQPMCNFLETNELQRINWGFDLPVVMYIDPSVPANYVPDIQAAANVWNEAGEQYLGIELFVIRNDIGSTVPGTSDNNVIYYLNSWSGIPPNEEAVTHFAYVGNRIYNAYISIDGYNFAPFRLNNSAPAINQIDLESLMIHEFGHVLGLQHDFNYSSVMYPYLNPGQVRDELSNINTSSIVCGYKW